MQIAELIKGATTQASTAFTDEITKLIKSKKLKKIIETGSYHGTGTTKAIAAGEQVYSIEVNPKNHDIAKKNNKGSHIQFLLGLSVDKSQIPVNITFDVPDHIIVDHLDRNRQKLYTAEVSYEVEDNLLDKALSMMDYKPDLVLLDSAGHMGLIEFKYLMERVKGKFYLALDDTLHVKHYNTMQYIKENTEQFKVIYETDEKFGSAIIKVSIF